MKKLASLVSICLVISVLGMASIISGCKITPEQGKIIAQNAGLYSAVIWIATENPTADQKTAVSSVLDVIKTDAGNVKTGQTYMVVLYPEVEKVINAEVKEQDRPLCKAAAITLLNGIDTMFAMHPDWQTQQDLAIDMVSAFVDGAKSGLIMTDKDPIIMQAKQAAQARARVLSGDKKSPVLVNALDENTNSVPKKRGWFGCRSSK